MDLYSGLKENQRLFDNGEIGEDEYNKLRKLILEKWILSHHITIPELEHSRESDLYAVLQLTHSATEAEIKSNYKKLSLMYHPDKNNGSKTEEWYRLSKAYQILSDENSRTLYDNYGTVNENFGGKVSFNHHVGGDPWKPYIGDLEIGFRLFSYMDYKSLPELEYVTSAEQKERRHVIRLSKIVRHLQDKLSRFPKQENSSEFKSSLRQEALKLSEEPNGKELLSLLGGIYVSEAEAYLNVPSKEVGNVLINVGYFSEWFKWFIDLIHASLESRFLKKEKAATKVAWRVSRSEISSIARETGRKILSSNTDEYANSLKILGEVWVGIRNAND